MPKSLVERFAEIAKKVPQIDKEGDNGTYRYLRAVDVFDTVRIRLFEAGILIVPISAKTTRNQPYFAVTGDITDEVIMEVDYLITDGKESIPCFATGIGQDHEGKALYMASTGAKKDLLKSLLLLAGVEDDTESVADTAQVDPGLAQKIAEMEKKFGTDSNDWIVDRQFVNAWCSAARTTGYRIPAQKAFLKKQFQIEKISDLKRKDRDAAMDWALGKTEIEGDGKDSSSPDEESSD